MSRQILSEEQKQLMSPLTKVGQAATHLGWEAP